MSESKAPVEIEEFRAVMREAGIEEIVEPTLAIYVGEATRLFDTLTVAVEGSDIESARAVAHSLKSSSANVSAHDLSALCQQMETAARNGDMDEVKSIFGALGPEFRRVVDYLAQAGITP